VTEHTDKTVDELWPEFAELLRPKSIWAWQHPDGSLCEKRSSCALDHRKLEFKVPPIVPRNSNGMDS
jgi:hypothetical protein